jgi:hypothetical protein
MLENPSQPVRRWKAIEPEMTHFHDIISLTFDMGSDRGTSDTYGEATTRPNNSDSFPWQRMVLSFWGGPLSAERPAVPVRCTFSGLVYFRFLQADFAPKMDEPEAQLDLFDRESLRNAAGYSHRDDLPDSMGAFCLWECDDSPLIDQFISRWEPWRPLAQRRPWLRHFHSSCDELGEFELVAGDVTIERLEHSSDGPS